MSNFQKGNDRNQLKVKSLNGKGTKIMEGLS